MLYEFQGNRLVVKLHKGQKRAWASDKKIVAVIAGTGSGKTSFGIIWLVRELQRPGSSALVVAPNYLMLTRILLPQAIEVLQKVYGGEYEAGTKTFKMTGNRVVYFGSAVDPFTLEGTHLDAVWLDEAGQMKEEVFRVALRRVSVKNGRILITSTPYSFNWLKKRIVDAESEDIDVINFASIENPEYPVEEFERAKKLLPHHLFEMFYLGKFSKPMGVVYSDFDPVEHTFYSEESITKEDAIAGVDFGYNNPTACVVFYVADGKFYAVDELYEVKLTLDDIVVRLKKLQEKHGIRRFYCDPGKPEMIEGLRRQGVPAVKAKADVQAGISLVQSLFKEGRLHIKKSLKNLLYELENYSYEEKNDEFTEKPLKQEDHAVDAMRYALFTYEMKGRAKFAVRKPAGF